MAHWAQIGVKPYDSDVDETDWKTGSHTSALLN